MTAEATKTIRPLARTMSRGSLGGVLPVPAGVVLARQASFFTQQKAGTGMCVGGEGEQEEEGGRDRFRVGFRLWYIHIFDTFFFLVHEVYTNHTFQYNMSTYYFLLHFFRSSPELLDPVSKRPPTKLLSAW